MLVSKSSLAVHSLRLSCVGGVSKNGSGREEPAIQGLIHVGFVGHAELLGGLSGRIQKRIKKSSAPSQSSLNLSQPSQSRLVSG
jgi:hypothetical protein